MPKEHLYEHSDLLKLLRHQVRRELLLESRKHTITAKLRQIPWVGPIRAALLVAVIQTPRRFRTKRRAYCELALQTRVSAEHCFVKQPAQCSKKLVSIRG